MASPASANTDVTSLGPFAVDAFRLVPQGPIWFPHGVDANDVENPTRAVVQGALDDPARRRLGSAFRALDAQDYERAVRALGLALDRHPDSAYLRYLKGASLYLTGDPAAARTLLDEAVASGTGLPQTDRETALKLLAEIAQT